MLLSPGKVQYIPSIFRAACRTNVYVIVTDDNTLKWGSEKLNITFPNRKLHNEFIFIPVVDVYWALFFFFFCLIEKFFRGFYFTLFFLIMPTINWCSVQYSCHFVCDWDGLHISIIKNLKTVFFMVIHFGIRFFFAWNMCVCVLLISSVIAFIS